MKIEVWNLDRIRPYPNNPRINDDAVDASLLRSVSLACAKRRLSTPMGSSSADTLASKQLKNWTKKLPSTLQKTSRPSRSRHIASPTTKTAELADWNYDLLPIELVTCKPMAFDLSLLGFDSDEQLKLL